MNDKYIGKRTVVKSEYRTLYSGDKMRIAGQLYNPDGTIFNIRPGVMIVGNELATFLYTEDYQSFMNIKGELVPSSKYSKYYFDIDGHIVYAYDHRAGDGKNLRINNLVTNNGKPVPDPKGQEGVDIATVALVGALGVSSIFTGAPLWWGTAIGAYAKYRKKKLYPDIDKK